MAHERSAKRATGNVPKRSRQTVAVDAAAEDSRSVEDEDGASSKDGLVALRAWNGGGGATAVTIAIRRDIDERDADARCRYSGRRPPRVFSP